MNRIALTTVLALSLITVSGAVAQDVITLPDPDQPLILVLGNGDWMWIRGMQRRGPMLEYYELKGRHVKTERFVSIPVEKVDLEAFRAVNVEYMKLGAACAEGTIREEDFVLEGRLAKIFEEVAQATVFIAEDGRQLKGCYQKLYLARRQKKLNEQAKQRTPQPTPTPWPTPTRAEVRAAEAEFRARQAAKEEKETEPSNSWSGSAPSQKSEVGTEEERIIREQCTAEWPDDFQMRGWCKKQQESALRKLGARAQTRGGVDSKTFDHIRRRCRGEWPKDFMMQNWCEETQIKGYVEFNQ